MAYRLLFTEGAERDLESIYEHIAESDHPASADRVLERLIAVAEQLVLMPERGSYPKELLNLGIKEYRQVFFKPYRLIYQVRGLDVVVFVVVDGRRDMQSLLTRRLLGASHPRPEPKPTK